MVKGGYKKNPVYTYLKILINFFLYFLMFNSDPFNLMSYILLDNFLFFLNLF